MRIVGVSFNSPEKNAKWVRNQQFPYEVWSDPERSLAISLGAARNESRMLAKRVTRVLDAQGRVVLSYDDVGVRSHPQDVLEDCRALFDR